MRNASWSLTLICCGCVGDLVEVRQGGLPIDFVEGGVDLVIRFDALSDKRLNARWTMSNRRLTCIRYRPNAAAADPLPSFPPVRLQRQLLKYGGHSTLRYSGQIIDMDMRQSVLGMTVLVEERSAYLCVIKNALLPRPSRAANAV